MDRLASCYFCGATLDDEVSERPVVPAQLATGEQRQATVVVCQGCDRKLDRVLTVVVNAVNESDERDERDRDSQTGDSDSTLAERPEDVLANLSADASDGADDDGESASSDDTESVADASRENGRTADTPESDQPRDTDGQSGDEADQEENETAMEAVSALEYNKVMRLVQNREFPVDRAEIEAVAANAYQISPDTCHRIIDEAIERDLLAEKDGDIVPKK